MNAGLISVRYATALLEYASEMHSEDHVYQEAKTIVQHYIKFEALRTTLANPVLDRKEKRKLILLAAGSNVSKPMERFIDLLLENNRQDKLQFILLEYIDLYREKKNLFYGKFTTSAEIDKVTEDKLISLVEGSLGGTLEVEHVIDPRLIGGFIFDVDFVRWDASLLRQIEEIRNELIEKNRRIV